MDQVPDQKRLSNITRHRLRFEAGPLDEAFVNFTQEEFKPALPHHLFMLSLRSLSVDPYDSTDGSSPTKHALDQLRLHVNNNRGAGHKFAVDTISEVMKRQGPDSPPTLAALDISVRFGVESLAGLLRPDRYVRSDFELKAAAAMGRVLKKSTVPQSELGTGQVRFRYMIPHAVENPDEPLEKARLLVEKGVKLTDLNIVDETRFTLPHSLLPDPDRRQKKNQIDDSEDRDEDEDESLPEAS